MWILTYFLVMFTESIISKLIYIFWSLSFLFIAASGERHFVCSVIVRYTLLIEYVKLITCFIKR